MPINSMFQEAVLRAGDLALSLDSRRPDEGYGEIFDNVRYLGVSSLAHSELSNPRLRAGALQYLFKRLDDEMVEPIGDIPPADAAARYYALSSEGAIAL